MRCVLLVSVVLSMGASAPAQDRPGPIWILRDEVPAAVHVGPGRPVGRLLIAVGLGAGAGVLAGRRRRPSDPPEAAFERLATRLGLTPDDRALLRRIGASQRIGSPVALLLSESALRRVLERTRRASRDPGERAHLHRIEALLLG